MKVLNCRLFPDR